MKKIIFILAALLTLHPEVPAGAALLAGIVFALAVGNPLFEETKKWTSLLLQVSVVGLGFGMNLLVVGKVGAPGVGYTAMTILLTLGVGYFFGRVLGVTRDASLLISCGTAICGGSAIAAVSAAIKPKSEDVSVSLATVFLLNAAALFIFPPLGHWAGLTEEQFGLWSALAVHDTSSVVGTASAYGATALLVGTTVKLARALWITPLTIGIGFIYSKIRQGGGAGQFTFPWFILGFVLAAALVTWVPPLESYGHMVASVAKRTLVITLFFIGSNLTMATIRAVGVRPMVQGVGLWIFAGSISFFAIQQGWIHL